MKLNGAFGWPTDKFVMLKIATGLIRTILKAFGIQTIQITIGRKNGKVNELIIVIVEEKRKIELFPMDCLWPGARMNSNNEREEIRSKPEEGACKASATRKSRARTC